MMADAGEMSRLCTAVLVGPAITYRDSLAFDDEAGTLSLADLADRAVFDDLLARFRSNLPGGDARAAASFWSQHYFAGLVIPLTYFALSAGRNLPLDVGSVGTRFCSRRGTPLCLHVAGRCPARPAALLFKALLEEQVAPAVAVIRRHSGLSARLLWENAGCYAAWVLGEVARGGDGPGALARDLLREAEWPAAAPCDLGHLKGAALQGRSAERRVCCLRYGLPGVGRCAGQCPLGPG